MTNNIITEEKEKKIEESGRRKVYQKTPFLLRMFGEVFIQGWDDLKIIWKNYKNQTKKIENKE